MGVMQKFALNVKRAGADVKQLFTHPVTFSAELLGIEPESEQFRNHLATAAGTVKAVTSVQEQKFAVAAVRDIQTYIREVEAAGLEYRRPLNAFAKQVKSAEDEHLEPIMAEKARIESLLVEFQ